MAAFLRPKSFAQERRNLMARRKQETLVLFPDLPPAMVACLTGINGFFLLYSFMHYFLAYFGSRNCLRDIHCD